MCPCFKFKKVAVFFLALAGGILGSFLFHDSKLPDSSQRFTEKVQRDPEPTAPNKSGLHDQTGIDSLLTDEQEARLLFGPILDDWLEGKRIPRVVEPSPDLIERIANTKLHRYQAPYLTDRSRRSYRTALVHLDTDKNPELVVIFELGDSAKGDLWIFRMEKGGFEMILHSREQFDGFEYKRTRTKGYLDIQTFHRPKELDSLESKSMSDYKFNGEKYTLRGCSSIVNRYLDKGGNLRYLKKPRLEEYDDCC